MTRILKSLAIAAILTAPLDANAQQNCAPRDVVLQHLSERFGESRQAIGMGPDGRVVEVFAALGTGSWTITITLPNGLTCLVASGDAYENLAEDPAPAGEAS